MPIPKFTEDTLSEQPAIDQLKRIGYIHIHGDQLDPDLIEDCERKSRKEVILVERLKRKLKDINPLLTDESINKAIRRITHIQAETTLEANKIFHKYLISGDSIDQDIGGRRQKQTVKFELRNFKELVIARSEATKQSLFFRLLRQPFGLPRNDDVFEFPSVARANLIDFEDIEKNEFLVVNQFWVSGYKTTDRPDIVIFINGIPIAVIECKSPVAKNTGVIDAQRQLIRYQKEIPNLFRTNEILIGCNLFGARYGTIEASLEQYHEWKDLAIDKLDKQEILIAGILRKENFLDIIQNFIVFDYDKETHKVIKKVCRYQQFAAVNKIVRRVTGETDKRGIIWHWQGSGKSLIMIFTAIKLRREQEKLKNPIILIVTDRRKLDSQITENFQNCNFPNPIQAESMKKLYSLLESGTGRTIMTTVQKFRKPLDKPLSDIENIIVMTDEAHRTQYGSHALNLRKAIPNASFFAFTGTPLNKRDRNTYRHFSPSGERYLDRYDMRQSMDDGATLPVKYESRLANLQIVGVSIDKLLKELFPEKSQKELGEIKRRYATIDAVLSSPRRIERIAMNIVNHYTERIAPNTLKAMIVASDRATAVKYKEALDKLIDPSWSTVVITIDNDSPQEWKEKYRRTTQEEEHITGKEVFQNPSNPLKFLIVCDKLLTGFDVPILQVMYLDQRMKEHTILQAIARCNRPYPRKNFGLVVDYIGVGKEIAEALAIFDEDDLSGLFTVDDLKKESANLKKIHRKTMSMFKKVKRYGNAKDIIQECLEVLKPEDVRAEFDTLFREFAKSIDILMPDPCVDPFIKDFEFLGMVREAARNLYRDERMSLENCSKKVEDLIHAHIVDAGVEEILSPINITAPDFEEKLELKGSPKAKASHMEYAIRATIREKIAEDPAFYGTLQEQLETLIETDRKRRKDEAELLRELVKISKQEERREFIAKEKGLTTDGFAFYGLLEPYKDELFKGNDEKRCQVTKEIIGIIENKKVIDWTSKEDIQKEMRRGIKNILIRIGFIEDKRELWTREVLELARARFRD